MTDRRIRIGAGAGSWGDDVGEPGIMLRQATLDYIVLDYLSEITLSILRRQMDRDSTAGFAGDVLTVMRDVAPLLAESETRLVTNAGGLNPRGCAQQIRELLTELGLAGRLKVALVEGDDLLPRLDELSARETLANSDDARPFTDVRASIVSANAYLGAGPICDALEMSADIVIAGRCVDLAMTLGPLMHEHGWDTSDFDRLASGAVAGHLVECGAQSTGGHSQHWQEISGLDHVGYPIVEVEADGSFVLTKAAGTGGQVTVRTATEQLLHEIFDPKAVLTPDVTVDWTSIRLEDLGQDRVKVTGVKGVAPPDRLKVSMTYRDGYRVILLWPYAWPHAREKAETALRKITRTIDRLGLRVEASRADIFGTGAIHADRARYLAQPTAPPEVIARFAARTSTREDAKRLSAQQAPMHYGPEGLAGFLTGGRGQMQPIYTHWPTSVPADEIRAHVELLS